MWPAALGVLLFAGLELVHPQRQDPRTVGLFLSLYAGMHLLAALVYGSRWFAAADGFEAYSTLVGRLSPLGRGPSGGWVLRSPLDTLDGLTPVPGTAAACCVLLGSTAYDGLTRSQSWLEMTGGEAASVPLGSAALLGTVLTVYALYVAATMAAGRLGGLPRAAMPAAFSHTLIPLLVGYAVAHYFSLFVFDGQQPLRILSDPLATGADYLGTAGAGPTTRW